MSRKDVLIKLNEFKNEAKKNNLNEDVMKKINEKIETLKTDKEKARENKEKEYEEKAKKSIDEFLKFSKSDDFKKVKYICMNVFHYSNLLNRENEHDKLEVSQIREEVKKGIFARFDEKIICVGPLYDKIIYEYSIENKPEEETLFNQINIKLNHHDYLQLLKIQQEHFESEVKLSVIARIILKKGLKSFEQ